MNILLTTKALKSKLEMALINWIISEREPVKPMPVRTTYPAYKPPFNLWIRYLQHRGTFVSINKEHQLN